MAIDTAVAPVTTALATTKRKRTPAQARSRLRRSLVGWAFVGPFAVVFLVFLIAPLLYALYLSLFKKALIGGTQFV